MFGSRVQVGTFKLFSDQNKWTNPITYKELFINWIFRRNLVSFFTFETRSNTLSPDVFARGPYKLLHNCTRAGHLTFCNVFVSGRDKAATNWYFRWWGQNDCNLLLHDCQERANTCILSLYVTTKRDFQDFGRSIAPLLNPWLRACCEIRYILRNLQIFCKYSVHFFHYWQISFSRMKWLCGPDLDRGPQFGDSWINAFISLNITFIVVSQETFMAEKHVKYGSITP